MSRPLTPEEQATLARLKAALAAAPDAAPAPGTRPERFSDFAPGMDDDGNLFEVDRVTNRFIARGPSATPAAKAPKTKK